jgi:hypothetical protein
MSVDDRTEVPAEPRSLQFGDEDDGEHAAARLRSKKCRKILHQALVALEPKRGVKRLSVFRFFRAA